MPRIAVVWDEGAVNAADVAIGLGPLGELAFVCRRASEPLLPLLAELGEVIDLDLGVDEVAGQLSKLAVDAVLTFSDAVLRETTELAERLGLPCHSSETVALLTDKGAQRARLHARGVDAVRTRTLRATGDWPAALAGVGLPAVLKPATGSGSRNTYLVTDPAAGAALAGALLGDGAGAYVLEEFLVGRPSLPYGDYVSVESAVWPDGVRHFAVTGKFAMLAPFREIGHIWPAPLAEAERDEVLALTTRALTALGVRVGIAHTELKLTPEGPRIIEVNGRLGGYLNDLGRTAYGVELVEVAGRLALGLPPPDLPDRPERVHFQYSSPMPTTACTLRGIDGVAQLRGAPGVTGYRQFYRPGESVEPSVMTRRIDMVFGNAASHDELQRVLDGALPHLRYRFTMDGADREFTAAELTTLAVRQPPG